ncbi:hypothetical protein N7454_004583 [Penicillium verhagenii]|nr:hypothetical protein N7454_004583 [Penicillium verhagenii]
MTSQGEQSPSLVTTALLVVAIIFPILGTLAILLRVWSNLSKAKRLFLDDYVIILAQICAWGISIDIFVAAALGGVDYTKGTVLSATIVFLRSLWIEGFVLIASLVLVKVSILLFYRRIFVTPWFQTAVRVYIAVLLSWGIAMIIAQLLCADPITAAWDPFAKNPLRYNYNAFSVAFAAMSLVFDVLVLCFPIPVIHHLMMSTRKKIQVLGIFWLGIFCCISSTIRLYYIYIDIAQSTATTGTNRYSLVTTAFTWGTIEPNVSVIAACLPTYGHFFGGNERVQSVARNIWSRLSMRSGGSGKGSTPSTTGPATIESNANSSFSPKRSNSRRDWQRLGIDTTASGDIEMGEHAYEEEFP